MAARNGSTTARVAKRKPGSWPLFPERPFLNERSEALFRQASGKSLLAQERGEKTERREISRRSE